MLEDVMLHMLLPVFYFWVRLLLRDVRRNVWGAFLSAIALEIWLLILFNLERFSSILFFSYSFCRPHLSTETHYTYLTKCLLTVSLQIYEHTILLF